MAKPSIPQGTRDFTADVVRKRNYIFNAIRTIFEIYGFEPLETPAMENGALPIFRFAKWDMPMQGIVRKMKRSGPLVCVGVMP